MSVGDYKPISVKCTKCDINLDRLEVKIIYDFKEECDVLHCPICYNIVGNIDTDKEQS